MAKRMLINAFSMNCVSHIQQGLWVRDDTRQLEYNQLEPWVELAQILEKGCFDALFPWIKQLSQKTRILEVT